MLIISSSTPIFLLLHNPFVHFSEIRARYENEENTQQQSDNTEHNSRAQCSLSEQLPHKRLANARPVHPRIFTKSEVCGRDIEFVLVGDDEVASDGKGEDQLGSTSAFYFQVGIAGISQWSETYPASNMSRHVGQYHVESTPEAGHQGAEAEDESDQDGKGDEVAESLGLEEAREGVALHGLKDIVFGIVEDFGVVAAFFFNVVDDAVEY